MADTELERMLVSLVGDATSYIRMLADAKRESEKATKEVVDAVEEVEDAWEVAATAAQGYGQTMKSVGQGMAIAGAAITATTGAIALFGLMAAGQFEQTTIAFETMLGSVKETEETLASLTTFAAKTPFEMPEILQAARGLIQFGERGDELMETLNLLGNASAATSTPFGLLALVFNQVRGVGKLLTQDFRQLSTRGIISLQDFVDQGLAPTTSAAQKMLSGGQISFQDLKDTLKGLSSEGGRFFNLMERQSTSLLGLWSTLTDAVSIFAREIGQELAPVVKTIVGLFIKWVEIFSAMPSSIKRVIAVVLGLAFAAGTALTVVGGGIFIFGQLTISMGAMLPMIRSVGLTFTSMGIQATAAWAAATLGISLILSAVIGLVAGLATLQAKFGVFNPLIGLIQETARSIGEELSEVFEELKAAITDAALPALEILGFAISQLVIASLPLIRLFFKFLINLIRTAAVVIKFVIVPAIQLLADTLEALIETAKGIAIFFGLGSLFEFQGTKNKSQENEEEESPAGLSEAELEAIANSIGEVTSSLQFQIETFGLSKPAIERYKLAMSGATEEQLAQVDALQAQVKEMGEMAKAHEEAIKAQEEATKAAQKLNINAGEYVQTLENQIDTFNMSARAAKIFALEQQGVSDAITVTAKSLDEELTVLEERKKLMEQGKQLTKQFLTPTEKMQKEIADLSQLEKIGAISAKTHQRALEALKGELERTFDPIQAVGLDTAQFQSLLQEASNRTLGLNVRGQAPVEPDDERVALKAIKGNTAKMVQLLAGRPLISIQPLDLEGLS